MINPFEFINERLNQIELLLLDLKRNPLYVDPSYDLEKPIAIQEAAAFLGLKPATLYGMVSRQEIPFTKKSKRLYFYESELKEWLAAGKRKTASELATEVSSFLRKGPKKKGGRS